MMNRPTIRNKFDFFPYALLLPAFATLCMVTLYPVVSSLVFSFFDYSFSKIEVPFIGLKNYIDIIAEGKFLNSFGFTLLWTVTNIVLMCGLGFATALFLNVRFAGRQLIKITLLVPWVIPQVVTGFVWSLMLTQDMGIINRILSVIGIIPPDFSWFQTGEMSFWAVVLANTWRGFPFFALMIFAKLQTLPVQQMEAAKIDGANAIQLFRFIVIHYIKPVLATCMMLGFLWTFNAFDIIRVMTNGGPLDKTVTLSLLVQREAFNYLEIGRASAMSVLMFLIILILILAAYLTSKLIERCTRK